MDSVTQKQNYLSLTGIDQMSENTDNIETLQGEMKSINDKLDILDGQVISLNNEDQIISGHKSFIHGITSTSVGCFYDPERDRVSNILLCSPDLQAANKPNYTLTFNARQGTILTGPITLDSEVLAINNVKGLFTQLTNLSNTSITTNTLTVQTSATVINLTVMNLTVTGTFKYANPVLNVTIPFQPSTQDAVTTPILGLPQPISFYAGATGNIAGLSAVLLANVMRYYKHPKSYKITHIGAMFDADTITAAYTTTIMLQINNADGSAVITNNSELAIFSVSATTNAGMFKFLTPISVLDNQTLSGAHSYSSTKPYKECYYVIYGYQA
jgi:hypothetical protein